MKLPNFDVIKIDVEGTELEVLETITDKIKFSKPILIVEILLPLSDQNINRIEKQLKIEKLIHNLDYKILTIIHKRSKLKELKRISTFAINDNSGNDNYIFYHKNDEENINKHFKDFINH